MASAAYPQLHHLNVGDPVPAELYVLDHRDGTRPRWTVEQRREIGHGVIMLILVDPDNGIDDLFAGDERVAVTVLTWPAKTLRSPVHLLGRPCGSTLCDMDQQGRAVTA